MLYFILGFSFGIYIGTYYNCKPMLSIIGNKIIEFIPEKKELNKKFK